MAYVDPGSGAYMVQMLFAMVGVGLFYLRHPIRATNAAIHWLIGRRGIDRSIASHASQPLPVVTEKSVSEAGAGESSERVWRRSGVSRL
jgi:hypothetical protein